MKDIRIGLLGFGAMGKVHAYAVDTLPYFYGSLPFRAHVRSLCTTSHERAQGIAEQYGFDGAVRCEDEIINDPEIDVVDICTPNIYHYDTLLKALQAGKHVLCEKPLCVTAEQAAEVADLAKESGLVCGMVFNNRHLLPIRRAKALIDEGRLGRILSFSFEYFHNSALFPEKSAGWKQDRDVCGGGVWFDLGSHMVDLLHHLCGEIETVRGLSQIAFPERLGRNGEPWRTNADEAFYMTAVLKNGACGTVTVSKLHCGTNDDLRLSVYGEHGAIRFSLMQPNFLEFYDGKANDAPMGGERGFVAIECVGRYEAPGGGFPAPKAPSSWLRGHVESMYRYLDAVYRHATPSPSFDDGAYVQAVLQAAYLSAKEDRTVAVSEVLGACAGRQ